MDFKSVWAFFIRHLEPLKNFDISFKNPVFWILYAVLFLCLLYFWRARKALSFCTVIAFLLLGFSYLERFIAPYLEGGIVDTMFVRTLASILIFVVVIYYIVVKTDS